MDTIIHTTFGNSKHNVCRFDNHAYVHFSVMDKSDLSFLRLLEVLEEKGIKPLAFQKQMELRSQDWTNWRKRGIPKKTVFDVAEKLGVSSDWLSNGKGEKYKKAGLIQLSDKEKRVIEVIRMAQLKIDAHKDDVSKAAANRLLRFGIETVLEEDISDEEFKKLLSQFL